MGMHDHCRTGFVEKSDPYIIIRPQINFVFRKHSEQYKIRLRQLPIAVNDENIRHLTLYGSQIVEIR